MERCKVHGVCCATSSGVPSNMGSRRDCVFSFFGDGGWRKTDIRSTVGFELSRFESCWGNFGDLEGPATGSSFRFLDGGFSQVSRSTGFLLFDNSFPLSSRVDVVDALDIKVRAAVSASPLAKTRASMTTSWANDWDPFGRRLITSAMRVSVSELSSICMFKVLSWLI